MGNQTKNWHRTRGYLRQRLDQREISNQDYIYNDKYINRDPEAILFDFFGADRRVDYELVFLIRYFKVLKYLYDNTFDYSYNKKVALLKEIVEFLNKNSITDLGEFNTNPSLMTLLKLQVKI